MYTYILICVYIYIYSMDLAGTEREAAANRRTTKLFSKKLIYIYIYILIYLYIYIYIHLIISIITTNSRYVRFFSEHNRVSNDSVSEGRELVIEPILYSEKNPK